MKVMKKPVSAEAIQLHETTAFPAMQGDPGMWLVIEKGVGRIMADHMFREEYNYRDPAVKMEPIGDVVCKYCGGMNLLRKGYRQDRGKNYMRRYCRDCEREFSIPEKQEITTSTAILTDNEQVSSLAPVQVNQGIEKVISKMESSPNDNFKVGPWTQAEIDVIRKEPESVTAIKAYHEKFPGSSRNDNAIQQKWRKLNPSRHLPRGNHGGKPPKYITVPPKKDQAPNKTEIGAIALPDELKPLEERKSFFVGAQVKQVSGRSPHAMGTGDIIEIKANGDIVVEFYHERKTCKRDELAFWSPDNRNVGIKLSPQEKNDKI